MNHLQLTPEAPPLEDDRMIPIDDPDEPMTEAVLRELELDRAADEGMIEPPGPEMEVPGTEVPGPEDEPRGPGVEVPGTEVPGPEDVPTDPAVEAPGRDDRPPIVSARVSAAGLSRTAWRAAREGVQTRPLMTRSHDARRPRRHAPEESWDRAFEARERAGPGLHPGPTPGDVT